MSWVHIGPRHSVDARITRDELRAPAPMVDLKGIGLHHGLPVRGQHVRLSVDAIAFAASATSSREH
jgi:hypothetical protein